MFDDFLLRRTDADVRRVVLLGAGLDARTYRLPWPRGCTVFEVDQEEVLAFKQRAPGTGRPGRPCPGPRARRVTVAADLRLDSIHRRRIRDSNS
ncbi:class I SAM-dependent methyltransferase [Streptomyces sp. NPDC014622]|uniref:class I SAM-dependent methyltransferase n=1 Tax=Streptomyces sp. NPDC014622 TaxID=3364874 RepID=UPI0036F6C9CE